MMNLTEKELNQLLYRQHAQSLFLAQYEDLARLVEVPNPYSCLRISAILRAWFLDNRNIFDQANAIKLKPRFEITDFDQLYDDLDKTGRVKAHLPFKPLDPYWNGGEENALKVEKDLKGFLNHSFGYLEGRRFKVKEHIKFWTNTMGGVHLNENSRKKFEQFDEYARLARMASVPMMGVAMMPIGRVALRATKTLQEYVIDQHIKAGIRQ